VIWVGQISFLAVLVQQDNNEDGGVLDAAVGSDTFGAKVAGTIGQPVTRHTRGRPRKDDKK